ncbi:spore coat protein [Alkalicoccobacillus murimartini]|uniref:Spore coat protein CotF n=1 Tax=Alkalicoccobacillus murimartini TaxID=171685 RepID=A0ABT9YGX8_9BACI|nr:spore coat protein [Alkalicoccobacillus murimartini]MDQ0207115.1 spore coat protein CotF [Alkalicoccobacillus murimartini]
MNNIPNQNQTHSEQIPPQMNHGGHDLFDSHEIIAGMINVLDQYMIFRSFMKDQTLIDILDRQYSFIESQYNLIVEAFSTGQKPSRSTGVYKMTQTHDVIYGIKPSQPKKPNQSLNDVKEAGLSAHMLGLLKSEASLIGMAACEVTNPVVRRVLADTIPNYIEMAYEVFLYQNKHAYYQVPQLSAKDSQAMTQAYSQATQPVQMPTPKSSQMIQ